VGLLDAGSLGHLVAELPLPVNALARPTRESRAELAALGVGRISFGPYLQRALADAARDLLTNWRTPAETDD
jgi:2-methylisocitrate lyase-like PEP mutase family enzyme